MEVEFPDNNYTSESSIDCYWVAFNCSFVWQLMTTGLHDGLLMYLTQKQRESTFSDTSKCVAWFQNSQVSPLFPARKSWFLLQRVRSNCGIMQTEEEEIAKKKSVSNAFIQILSMQNVTSHLAENILLLHYKNASG